MAVRSVSVHLRAEIGGFLAGMAASKRAVSDFAAHTGKEAAKGKAGFRDLGLGVAAIGAGVAALGGVALSKFADFDQAMSAVSAATHETAANMALLRQAALDAGATTVFTAGESADAIESLAKAGVSTADVLGGGLKGALDLAAAGTIAVGDAADVAATAMTQFRLSGEDVPHIADLLAAAAGKAQGDVGDMSMALKQSGLVAAQMGLSIEQATGTLAAFASAGLLGSDAGTSFRTMLLRLANPSGEAADLMQELGIAAYDTRGQFVGTAELAGQLAERLGGLSQKQRDAALATIFGSDAIRAANVLYQQGRDGIEKWTGAVDDQGYAAETAQIKLDNLRGDVERLTGALDTAFITMGEGADGPARDLVQALTGAVDSFNALPAPAKQATLLLLGLLGAVSLLGGGLLVLAPKIDATRVALRGMGVTAASTRAFLAGPWGAAIGVATIALGLLGQHFANAGQKAAEMKAQVQELTGTLDTASGAITGATRAAIIQSDAFHQLVEKTDELGISTAELVTAIFGSAEQWEVIRQKYRQVAEGGGELLDSYRDLTGGVGAQREALERSQETWALNQEAARAAGAQNEITAGAMGKVAEKAAAAGAAVDEQADAVSNLDEALDALYGRLFDVEAAQDAFTESIKDGVARAEDGKLSTLELREAGRQLAQQAFDVIDAMAQQGASTEQLNAKSRTLKDRIYDAMIQMGASKTEARRYAEALDDVPSQVVTAFTTPGMPAAKQAVMTYTEMINGIPRTVTTTIYAQTMRMGGPKFHTGGKVGAGDLRRFHQGGVRLAPDETPAILQTGERVLSRVQNAAFERLMGATLRPVRLSAAPAMGRAGDTTINVRLENRGVIGSQREMQNWLSRSFAHLDRNIAEQADIYRRTAGV